MIDLVKKDYFLVGKEGDAKNHENILFKVIVIIKKKGDLMKLTPPTKNVFWISVVLVVLGIVASFFCIPFLSGIALWLVVAGYVLLFLGNAMKGF